MKKTLGKIISLLCVVTVARIVSLPRHADAIPVDRSVVEALEKGLVTHICSDRGQWLTCFNLAPERCNEITEQFVKPCVDRLSASFPSPTSEREMVAWGQQLSRCFNTVFGTRYGKSQKNTPECQQPPAHLR